MLLLLQAYHLGYEVGRYISLERIIERNRDCYYETLEQSFGGWHEKAHDPWPYIRYLLFVLKEAYRELETWLGDLAEPRGVKTETVLSAIDRFPGTFSVAELRARCPGVIRKPQRGGRKSAQGEASRGTSAAQPWVSPGQRPGKIDPEHRHRHRVAVSSHVMKQEHFEVLLEEMRGHFQLLGEGLQGVNERIDRLEAELTQEIRSVGTRVDGLESRFDGLESRFDGLDDKVDRLARDQRDIKKQLGTVLDDHDTRITRLEHPAA